MPENMPKPTTEISVTPVAKLRSENAVRSTIGSLVISSRIRKPASAQTATMVIATIVGESDHSSRSPRSSTSCRHAKPTTIRPRPHQPIRAARRRYGGGVKHDGAHIKTKEHPATQE